MPCSWSIVKTEEKERVGVWVGGGGEMCVFDDRSEFTVTLNEFTTELMYLIQQKIWYPVCTVTSTNTSKKGTKRTNKTHDKS